MYQWSEESHEHDHGSNTYTYSKIWDEEPIQSSGFHNPNGHNNPSVWTYTSNRFVAEKVTLGAFRLSTTQIDRMDNYVPLQVDDTHLNDVMKKSLLVTHGTYTGKDPQSPMVGDLQITFSIVQPSDISIVSEQTKDSFEAYSLKDPFVFSNDKKTPFSLGVANFIFGTVDSLMNGNFSTSGNSLKIENPQDSNSTATDTSMDAKKIDLLEVGSYTSNEMFERAHEMNDAQTCSFTAKALEMIACTSELTLTDIRFTLGCAFANTLKISSAKEWPTSSTPSKSNITVSNFSKPVTNRLAWDLAISFSPSCCSNFTGTLSNLVYLCNNG
jgi:Transmembrane protein 43